ncbi:MAG: GTP 3',8-cyclase MoaA [Lachnospiraceae bacterium]|nr:GTP 3',8-cyclase MoaA [Lachnospiraceae bacterium]
MKDGFGREIDYARISVTDKCNMRCRYCMPSDIEHLDMKDILTFEEIAETVSCMADLGISKIRLTGGEPLVRRGICDLVAILKGINGVKEVNITTNGLLLAEYLPDLCKAGIDGVNISIDTLDPVRYKWVTGCDGLSKVLSGVKACISAGLRVKINAVTGKIKDPKTGEYSDPYEDVSGLIDFAKDKNVCVRFIELMPIGFAKDYPSISHEDLISRFLETYPDAVISDSDGNGPAKYYKIPGHMGETGFISAISDRFCADCNRVRLTTKGFLKSCLCYDKGADLKGILRSAGSASDRYEKLTCVIKETILEKPFGHDFLHEDNVTEKHAMSAIGG